MQAEFYSSAKLVFIQSMLFSTLLKTQQNRTNQNKKGFSWTQVARSVKFKFMLLGMCLGVGQSVGLSVSLSHYKSY